MNQQNNRVPVDMTGQNKKTGGAFDQKVVRTHEKHAQEDQEGVSNGSGQTKVVEVAEEALRAPKEDFMDVFEQQKKLIEKTQKGIAPKIDPDQETIENLNKSLSGEARNDIDEDIVKISAEDMKLAEQLIFNSYAECNIEMKNFPGRKFTITSTNAEELNMVDSIVFDRIRSAKQNNDGSVELPENFIRSLRNSLFISISYRGFDGNDIAKDPICHLNTLKRAILKLGDVLNSGEIDKGEELKKNICAAMVKRATLVKRMPTPLIDFLTDAKYHFDLKMLSIMNKKDLIPLN
jgi:hypothetical protein